MPILSSKRQVTLPKEMCDSLDINPGDDLDILAHAGKITILKKKKGSSAGTLRHVKGNPAVSEAASLHDAVSKGPAKAKAGKKP